MNNTIRLFTPLLISFLLGLWLVSCTQVEKQEPAPTEVPEVKEPTTEAEVVQSADTPNTESETLAQATGYKIGMLKILELRQEAMDALGEASTSRIFIML